MGKVGMTNVITKYEKENGVTREHIAYNTFEPTDIAAWLELVENNKGRKARSTQLPYSSSTIV
jgi:hypothetical protein